MRLDGPIADLVAEMRDAGWTITPTTRGHVKARAPDGDTLLHFGSKEGHGRATANARARFKRWQRQTEDAMTAQDTTAPMPETFSCEHCGRRFESLQSLSGHLRIHGPSTTVQYPCPECDKVFLSSQGRGAHRSRVHGVRGSEPSIGLIRVPDEFPVPELITKPEDAAPVADTWERVLEDLFALVMRVETLTKKQTEAGSRLRGLLDDAGL